MPYEYNKNLTAYSQDLRKNMTPEEQHLWYDFLKFLPLTVNRQKMIGNYIVDFYIHEKKIAIEIDGIQHNSREGLIADKKRDAELANLGVAVLRYPNYLVNNDFSYVCQDILNHIGVKYKDLAK